MKVSMRLWKGGRIFLGSVLLMVLTSDYKCKPSTVGYFMHLSINASAGEITNNLTPKQLVELLRTTIQWANIDISARNLVMRISEEEVHFSMIDNVLKQSNAIDESCCMFVDTKRKDKLENQSSSKKATTEEKESKSELTRHEVVEEEPILKEPEEHSERAYILKKEKDLDRFYIPCKIKDCILKELLLDTGASVNVMSLELFQFLGYSVDQDLAKTIFMLDN
ncbi:hypothetical protein L6164_037435 [Bauhinia variegata]|uniref:Uncharacterized protein n=1 Tax=Bauhinia variegata TaxID=167791 RepID=A0ACB9KJW8_BAUVA|nr:hypothetical protein L6164_037435 [Bauhinia variegata]